MPTAQLHGAIRKTRRMMAMNPMKLDFQIEDLEEMNKWSERPRRALRKLDRLEMRAKLRISPREIYVDNARLTSTSQGGRV